MTFKEGQLLRYSPLKGGMRRAKFVKQVAKRECEITVEGDPFPVLVKMGQIAPMRKDTKVAKAATKPTAKQLRDQARNLNIPEWEGMNRAQLESAINEAVNSDILDHNADEAPDPENEEDLGITHLYSTDEDIDMKEVSSNVVPITKKTTSKKRKSVAKKTTARKKAAPVATVEEIETPTPKRGRGRPRKTVEAVEEIEVKTTVKRKRGRPASKATAKKTVGRPRTTAAAQVHKSLKTAAKSSTKPKLIPPTRTEHKTRGAVDPNSANPFGKGSNMWHITEALKKGGKRSTMAAALVKKIDFRPRNIPKGEVFDPIATADNRLLVVGSILKRQYGFKYYSLGRGEDAYLQVVPESVEPQKRFANVEPSGERKRVVRKTASAKKTKTRSTKASTSASAKAKRGRPRNAKTTVTKKTAAPATAHKTRTAKTSSGRAKSTTTTKSTRKPAAKRTVKRRAN
jgi:hypothetical protein